MNTYYEQLKEKLDNFKKEVELLRCCGNCRYYNSHECYCFHNWEPYKKCNGEGQHKWTFVHR